MNVSGGAPVGRGIVQDVGRVRLWLRLRDKIRRAPDGPARLNLLRRFADEAHAALPRAELRKEDIVRAYKMAPVYGVVLGAWLHQNPMNPAWPGRDRLFVTCREDLVDACLILSVLGFFPLERIAWLVERVYADGRAAAVPGLESPGVPAGEVPALLWESAVESARSKRRWRERVAGDLDWVEPSWLASPAVWRSCAVFDASDPAAAECRALPARGGEAPAGLAVLVKAPAPEAEKLTESWAESGWEALAVNRKDSLRLHDVLTRADTGRPLAVILAGSYVSRTAIRKRESELLGELSDERFHEAMEEMFDF